MNMYSFCEDQSLYDKKKNYTEKHDACNKKMFIWKH